MMGPTTLKEIRETLERHFTADGRPRSNRRTRSTPEGRKLVKELEQFIEALRKEVKTHTKYRPTRKR
jgi:hypothetical protein